MTDFEVTQIENVHTWALPRTPASRIISTANWFQVISEDYKSPAFNEIIHSSVASNEDEQIVEALRTYEKIGTNFKWCLGPRTKPSEFGVALKRHGFVSWTARQMYLRLAESTIGVNRKSGVTVRVMHEADHFFTDLFLKCWQIDPLEQARVQKQLQFDHRPQGTIFERFMAFIEDQPVGVASLARNERCGLLHATAVLPQHQGKGVYRELVAARLDVLRAAGAQLAITAAREATSAPRLEKLGFQTAWPTEIFLKKF